MNDFSRPLNNQIIEASCGAIHLGELFEELMNLLLATKYSLEYLPLGGTKDGGKDGVFYDKSRKELFQFSIESRADQKFEKKVVKTIRAIEKSSPDLLKTCRLNFYFSYPISPARSQSLADDWHKQAQYSLVIRGSEQISYLVNESSEMRSQFWGFIENKGIREIVENVPVNYTKTSGVDSALVYLTMYDHAKGIDFLEHLIRTHVFLSLRETDPYSDPRRLKKITEIIDHVISQAPFLTKEIVARYIATLLKKERFKKQDDRDLRQYEKDGDLCLSFNARQEITASASEVVNCEQHFRADIASRVVGIPNINAETIADLVFKCLAKAYTDFGMDLVRYIKDGDTGPSRDSLVGICQSVLCENPNPDFVRTYRPVLSSVLYNVIWRPTENEKKFREIMSRSFSLIFTTKGDAAVLNYLQRSATGLRFILGTDIIIKIFAETHLPEEKQRYVNMVKSLRSSGIEVSVTDPIVTEAAGHIRTTIDWYNENIGGVHTEAAKDQSASELLEFLEKSSPKILVRAYYHARKDGKISTFNDFVELFISSAAQTNLKDDVFSFLEGELGVKVDQIAIDQKMVETIKTKLLPLVGAHLSPKHREILASNDAKTIVTVYAFREKYKLSQKFPLLSSSTWWLTEETKGDRVRQYFVDNHGMVPHLHPEVACVLLANLPSLRTSAKNMQSILASAVGMQLSSYIDDSVVKGMVETYKQLGAAKDGRKLVLIRQMVRKVNDKAYSDNNHILKEIFGSNDAAKRFIEELRTKASSANWEQVWKIVIREIEDTTDRLVVFTSAFNKTASEAMEFLKSHGGAEEVKGIAPSIIDWLLEETDAR